MLFRSPQNPKTPKPHSMRVRLFITIMKAYNEDGLLLKELRLWEPEGTVDEAFRQELERVDSKNASST